MRAIKKRSLGIARVSKDLGKKESAKNGIRCPGINSIVRKWIQTFVGGIRGSLRSRVKVYRADANPYWLIRRRDPWSRLINTWI